MADLSRPRRLLLKVIVAIHTMIFAIELASIGWLIATGVAGRRDRTVGVAAGLVAAESVIWLANDRACPLTTIAEQNGAERGSVSDILLPDAMARTLPVWSSGLLLVAAAFHAHRAWGARAARETRP